MQQTELIVAYIRGELAESQRRDFEQRLIADPSLQRKLKDYQVILQGLKGMQYEAFRREVAGWDLEEEVDTDRRLITDYLAGNMAPEAAVAFEKRLNTEPDLADTVKDWRTLAQGFKAMRRAELESEVQQWAESLPGGKQTGSAKVVSLPKKRNTWWRYAVAAVLLALVAVAIWQLVPSGLGGQDLTAFSQSQYIAPAPAVERGSKTMLEEGVTAFETGNYTLATSALDAIPAEDSLYVTAQFFLGHAHFKMERYTEAIAAFTKSLDAAEAGTYQLGDFNADNAAWTRILARLAQTNNEKDTTLQRYLTEFLDQADRTDVYYQKAQALDGQLK